MLKSLRYLLIILLSVSAFSCKKGERSTAGLKEQLVNKWYYDSIFQKDYDKDGKLTKTTQLAVRVNVDNINFKADDSFTSVVRTLMPDVTPDTYENVTTNGTFKVTSLTRFTMTNAGTTTPLNCNIKSLTPRELIFNKDVAVRVTGKPYTVIEHTLHR
ncbi:hypothetical protein [Mucilaginibacter terrae]|uniref:Lipocalin-like domain-containing protein n=1 Tax=Mucilaginibacter terrae TaxID=1955052 RepID=A0ABU3GYH0_9SPHI|nr:hypothetical protein [Mucilaginibacter terrae]MDT3404820.1 hypothetical protein [Mucilaginibacter terrae]